LAKLKPFAARSIVGGLLSLMELLMAQFVIAAAAPDRALSAMLLDESTLLMEQAAASVVENNILGTSSSGIYTLTFLAAVPLGSYRLIIVDNITSYGIAHYSVTFSGTDGETVNAAEFVDVEGGDATAANQAAIIAAISPITTVYTSQPSSETINLIRGDAYDGIANNKLAWTASKDVDGEQVNFTIRDSKDNIVLDQTTAGVVTSAVGDLVAVSLSTSATELLDPDVSVFKFDVEIEFSADSRWTITKGNVCVEGDESR